MSSAREVIKTTLCEYSGGGQGVDDMLDAIAEQQTDAILRALDAAGMVVVPVDATLTTIKEGWKQMPSLTDRRLRCIWRAMVAAAGREG